MYRRYVYTAIMSFLLVSVGVISVNLMVDPYDLYEDFRWRHDSAQLDLFWYLRLHKSYKIRELRPAHLIVGSSRSGRLPPQNLSVNDRSTYNASLPGVSQQEMFRVVEHAHVIRPLDSIVLGLDYYMFREGHEISVFYLDARLLKLNASPLDRFKQSYQQLEDKWRTLYSVDATLNSYKVHDPRVRSNRRFNQDGTWSVKSKNLMWAKKMLTGNVYSDFLESSSSLDFSALVELLQFSEKQGIAVTVLISPIHAVAMNAINLAGAWPGYLDWQRQVAAIVGQYPGVRLYGGEGSQHLVHEDIRLEDGLYQDVVHYSVAAGHQFMQCITAECTGEIALIELTQANIEDYLVRVDNMMRSYAEQQPEGYSAMLNWVELRKRKMANGKL